MSNGAGINGSFDEDHFEEMKSSMYDDQQFRLSKEGPDLLGHNDLEQALLEGER